MNHLSNSVAETTALAAEFAQTLKGGELVSLIGDLGTGKTTFARGLVRALGGTARVTSPTFTVMQIYPVVAPVIKRVVHLDFYRFTHADELSALALEDEKRADTLILAEWPDVLGQPLLIPDVTITFEHDTLTTRRITIS